MIVAVTQRTSRAPRLVTQALRDKKNSNFELESKGGSRVQALWLTNSEGFVNGRVIHGGRRLFLPW